METGKFPFGAAVKFGWQKIKENFWPLVAVTVIGIIVNAMFSYSVKSLEKTMPAASFIVNLCSTAVNMIMTLGITKIGLKVYAGEKFEVSEIFESYRLFLKYLLATILYFLAVIGGLILLIVPGIILIIRMGLYTYLIVDKQMGPLEALKESMRLTKGNAFNLFLFWFLLLGVLILGFLCLIVGLIVAIPVSLLAYVFVYRYLEAKNQPAQTPAPVQQV